MSRRRKMFVLQWSLAGLGIGVATLALVWLTPYAMADRYRQRQAREERIWNAIDNVDAQQTIDKELRKLSIRHKPRPVPARRTH